MIKRVCFVDTKLRIANAINAAKIAPLPTSGLRKGTYAETLNQKRKEKNFKKVFFKKKLKNLKTLKICYLQKRTYQKR